MFFPSLRVPALVSTYFSGSLIPRLVELFSVRSPLRPEHHLGRTVAQPTLEDPTAVVVKDEDVPHVPRANRSSAEQVGQLPDVGLLEVAL